MKKRERERSYGSRYGSRRERMNGLPRARLQVGVRHPQPLEAMVEVSRALPRLAAHPLEMDIKVLLLSPSKLFPNIIPRSSHYPLLVVLYSPAFTRLSLFGTLPSSLLSRK